MVLLKGCFYNWLYLNNFATHVERSTKSNGGKVYNSLKIIQNNYFCVIVIKTSNQKGQRIQIILYFNY